MAFGKPPEMKPLKFSPNVLDQLWKASIRSEETATAAWKEKWGWILVEYEKLKAELDEATRNSILPKDKVKYRPPETRTLKPFPRSVASDIGWLPSRKEWLLEIYGPDVDKGMPYKSMSD